MDEGADSGDILAQEVIKISEGMNSQELYEEVIKVSKIKLKFFTRITTRCL